MCLDRHVTCALQDLGCFAGFTSLMGLLFLSGLPFLSPRFLLDLQGISNSYLGLKKKRICFGKEGLSRSESAGPRPVFQLALLRAAAQPCLKLLQPETGLSCAQENHDRSSGSRSYLAGLGLGSSVCNSRDTREHNESQDFEAAVLKVVGFKSPLCLKD